ncbi:MAG: hypothetical protein Q9227_004040 [Pyrenula ochraceoflavens]
MAKFSKEGRTAFISGHLDLKQSQFRNQYHSALDAAVAHGDRFIVSDSKGADTMALEYLLQKRVDPARITIYLADRGGRAMRNRGTHGNGRGHGTTVKTHAHFSSPSKSSSHPQDSEIMHPRVARFQAQGVLVKLGWSNHTARDEAMTKQSDYDIAWVRPEAETRELYGHLPNWREGRISGTEKNLMRRNKQTNIPRYHQSENNARRKAHDIHSDVGTSDRGSKSPKNSKADGQMQDVKRKSKSQHVPQKNATAARPPGAYYV